MPGNSLHPSDCRQAPISHTCACSLRLAPGAASQSAGGMETVPSVSGAGHGPSQHTRGGVLTNLAPPVLLYGLLDQ